MTNYCNLKCFGCGVYCDHLITSPFFISINDIKKNIKQLKKIFETSSLTSIDLTGGEVLFHPYIKEICQLLRKEFPMVGINIYTNGLSLINNELLLYMQKNNISLLISIYPRLKYFQQYENLIVQLNNFQISYKLFNHFLFTIKKSLINHQKESSIPCSVSKENKNFSDLTNYYLVENDFSLCCNLFGPHTYIVDKNLYQNCLMINNIQDLSNNCLNSLPICTECITNPAILIPWHESNTLINYNIMSKFNWDMFQLFCDDYYRYYHIYYDNDSDYEILLHHPLYQKNFLTSDLFEEDILKNKYLNGYLDICIYYNDNQIKNVEKLIKNIQNQTIISKCNLYFIVDNSQINKFINTKTLYQDLTPYSTNKYFSYFLQANSFTKGKEIFQQHSFLKYKYYLNINDDRLQDSSFFEKIYKEELIC